MSFTFARQPGQTPPKLKGGSPARISKYGEPLEREADRVAQEVVRGGRVTGWSLSKAAVGHVQRQDADKPLISDQRPKSEGDKYKEGATKLGEAFLKTDVGKKLEDAASKDPLVKDVSTLEGKVIAGVAAAGVLSALAATHTALPAQIPEIPLDKIQPGLKAKLTYEGPVDHPSKAMITFSYTPEAKKKKPAQTESERYRAETARIAAEQDKLRAGMKYTPGSPEDLQQKAEDEAMQAYITQRYSTLPGFGGKPLIPGGKDPGALDSLLGLKPPTSPLPETKKEEAPPVQRKAAQGLDAPADVSSAQALPASGGRSLDAETRGFMESKFGFDFGKVRVHTDGAAAARADSLHALAYTIGPEVVFGAGRYAPETAEGRKLIAHELTHVIQQSGNGPSRPASAAPEREAECAARSVMEERRVWVPEGTTAAGVACAPGPADPRAVAQALVQQLQAANKPVVVNVGGTGASHEPADAINVNPNVVAPRKDIPNLVQAKGEEIGNLFSAGQVNKVVGNRLSPDVFDWDQIAAGAHSVLRDGGTVNINFRWANKQAAENLVQALKSAGFQDVKNVGDAVVMATKGSGGSPVAGGGGVPPATGTPPPVTGGAGGLKAATEGEGAPAELQVPKASTVETAGAAAETEATAGLAGEIAGIALEAAAGLIIGVAIGLFLDWLKGLIEEAMYRRDIQALSPQIQARLQQLIPQITQLQQHGKVYARITIDVRRKAGAAISTEGGFLATATWDNYDGVTLGDVQVAGDSAPNARRQWEEQLSPQESRTHYVETFSTLLDDPQKRARARANPVLLEHLKKIAPKSPPPPPPPPSQTQQLLPSPGVQAPPPTFNPLPGAPGPSPLREAEAVVENFKTRCRDLLARGENLISTSGAQDTDIKTFKNDEDIWRTKATLVKNHFADHGPDVGERGMDEVINSDQYGGRLKQIRNTLGG